MVICILIIQYNSRSNIETCKQLFLILGNLFALMMQYYTMTDFCRGEYELLLTCKIILNEAEG